MPTFAAHNVVRIDAEHMVLIESAWRTSLQDLFDVAPIAFRTQNGRGYPNPHVLVGDVVPGRTRWRHISKRELSLRSVDGQGAVHGEMNKLKSGNIVGPE